MARATSKSAAGQAEATGAVISPRLDPEADSVETDSVDGAAGKSGKATGRKAPAKKTAAKKAAGEKAAPAELVVKPGEEAWTDAELAEVLAELHEQRKHSLEVIGAQESELTGLMRDAGDGAGHDQADVGATTFERDHELSVLLSERDKIAQIDRAVARIDDGSYGQCESCGQPIGKMRLMAFPRATLCLTCKQREERR